MTMRMLQQVLSAKGLMGVACSTVAGGVTRLRLTSSLPLPLAAMCQRMQYGTAAGSVPAPGGSVDAREAQKFAALASTWWHPSGPFAPLHRLNSARCKFIRHAACAIQGLDHTAPEPFAGLRVLDVGCGGGILAESLARLGAHTHGIDITNENIQAARVHAALDPLIQSRTRYDCVALESVAEGQHGSTGTCHAPAAPHCPPYDIVLASEVIEHVKRPDTFLHSLAAVLRPGGSLVVSTISRTPASYAVAILGAEYITGIVPRGTHDWTRFVTPQEMYLMASDAKLTLAHAAGMQLGGQGFVLTQDLDVNYIAAFHKPLSA